MLRLGGYGVNHSQQQVRLDSNNAPAGVFIDFADTLGGETTARVGRLDGYYRIDDRQSIGFAWYALRFTGRKTLDKDIQWGDASYSVGTTLDSEIKFNVYKVNYRYSLLHTSQAELGGLAGFHVMGAAAGLSPTSMTKVPDQSVTAPLPVLGLYASYHFTPRLSAYYNYQFFFISYDDRVKGSLQDFLLGMEYRVSPHFGLGAALNQFSMDLQSREDLTTLYVNSSWSGVMLYGSLYF